MWILLWFLLLFPAWAQTVPKPGHNGDYWVRNEHAWPTWKVVVDVLVGRRAADWPTEWQKPGALLHLRWDIWRWPEVVRFRKGTVMTGLADEGGGMIIKDGDGYSWLRVSLPGEKLCFVRANKKQIQPTVVESVP